MELQQRVLHKADELFRTYGIRSVTMDDIAKALGISKKTLYQSYSDKDLLILAKSNKNSNSAPNRFALSEFK